jgi:hypothetical protein
MVSPRPLPNGEETLGHGVVHFVPHPSAYRGLDVASLNPGQNAFPGHLSDYAPPGEIAAPSVESAEDSTADVSPPDDDTSTNDTPTNDTPTNDTPTNDTPTNDTPTNDTPTNDTPRGHTPRAAADGRPAGVAG